MSSSGSTSTSSAPKITTSTILSKIKAESESGVSFTTRININVFGEAHFEAVLIPVTMLVILVSFFYYVKNMKVDEVVKK